MNKEKVRVHIVNTLVPLNTNAIARQIAQQMREGKNNNDRCSEIRRGA